MKFSSKLILLIIVFYVFISIKTFSQSAEQVVDRYLKAIGGVSKWNSINSKIEKALYITFPSKNSAVFGNVKIDTLKATKKFKRPSKIFYSLLRNGDSISLIMCNNNKVFWTQNKNGQLSVHSKEEGEDFVKTSMMGFADVLLKKDTELEYLGKEKLCEEEFYVLRVKGAGWYLSSKWYFDKETGLLFCASPIDSSIKRYTIFKNYEKIDDVVLFHFLEEVYDDQWNLESRYIFINRKVNVVIDDSEFDIPHSN
ncbi:MAG: hypothetical protein JNL53_09125 [Cyclobacteriaceae bacterium]|nr:hypothetical protein [Cyclobacteriaceae bacterium]